MTKSQRIGLMAGVSMLTALPLMAGRTEAQGPRPPRFANLTAQGASVAAGGKTMVSVVVDMKPGFHIYANKPGSTDVIATSVTLNKANGLTFGAPVFPAAKAEKVAGMPNPLNVYSGKVVIKVPVTVAKTAKGAVPVSGTIRMQGCNESMCYPPGNFPFTATVTVK